MDPRPKTKTLLIALSFLLALNVIALAEIGHPLHEPDSSCEICLAVDHLSTGLISIESDHHLLLQRERKISAIVSEYVYSLLSAYSVRAPPLP